MLTIENIEREWMCRLNETQAHRENRADDDNARRVVCDMLMMWTACEDRRCKRARVCVGDRTPDGPRCCSDLGGEQQAWLTALCAVFRADGSWPDAIRAGREATDRCRADEEMRELTQMVARQMRLHLQKLRARLRVRPAPAAVAPG